MVFGFSAPCAIPQSNYKRRLLVRSEIIYCFLSLACAGRLFLVSSPFANTGRVPDDNDSGHVEKEGNNQMDAWLPTSRVNKSVFNETKTFSNATGRVQPSLHTNFAVRTGQAKVASGRKLQLMMMRRTVAASTRTKPDIPESSKLYLGSRHRRASYQKPIPLKVGLPIFVASLPKSGTTSIATYFSCGGRLSSHHWVRHGNLTKGERPNPSQLERAGECIQRNVQQGNPPFHKCGIYDVYSDTGIVSKVLGGPRGASNCFYPSLSALRSMIDAYPNLTVVLVVRNATSWYNSLKTWGVKQNNPLLKRFTRCNSTDWPLYNPHDNTTQQQMQDFYEWHNEQVRKTVRSYTANSTFPRLVEVQLESTDTGRILEHQIGIPSACWGDCSPSEKHCTKAR
jgi:Sulfotransferase domain